MLPLLANNAACSRVFSALRTLAIFACCFLAVSSTTFAKKKQPPPPSETYQKIVNVDAVSVTISIGLSGDNHETYVINDQTKVTLDGAPANARDLRAGMVASVETSADKKTAVTITAKAPPAHPDKHRTG